MSRVEDKSQGIILSKISYKGALFEDLKLKRREEAIREGPEGSYIYI
jgi:hypothetical protein